MQAETAGRKACSGRFGDVSTAGEVRLYFRYLRFHVFVYRFFHMREGAAASKKSACPGGKFVFSAETMAARCPDDEEETISAQVKTSKGFDLILKTKNAYDEKSGTQFSPGNYELYDKGRLIRREFMDFQTHLYRLGEMEQLLTRVGFQEIKVYSDFDKEIARDDQSEMFLYECTL